MSYEAFAYYYDSLMDQNFYNDYIQFINEHVKDYQTVLELVVVQRNWQYVWLI